VLRAELDKNDYPFSVSGRGEADPAVPNTPEKESETHSPRRAHLPTVPLTPTERA
jgi:hypothetical protein